MKRLSLPVLVCCGCFGSYLSALQAANPEPTFEELGASSYRFDWTGEAGLTYFVQYSQDLQNWQYFPLIDHGVVHDPVDVTPLDASNNPLAKYFMRLVYTDIPTTDPEGDDFDGDGIPNLYELVSLSTDPLNVSSAGGDSDGDGMPDGWELFYFGNLAQLPATVLEGDGLTLLEKAQLGMSPLVDYAEVGEALAAEFLYDAAGRLSSAVSPLLNSTFTPDAEGNLAH